MLVILWFILYFKFRNETEIVEKDSPVGVGDNLVVYYGDKHATTYDAKVRTLFSFYVLFIIYLTNMSCFLKLSSYLYFKYNYLLLGICP